MALKPCRECGKQVATTARTCPDCGAANPTRSADEVTLTRVLLILMLGGMVVIWGLMSWPE